MEKYNITNALIEFFSPFFSKRVGIVKKHQFFDVSINFFHDSFFHLRIWRLGDFRVMQRLSAGLELASLRSGVKYMYTNCRYTLFPYPISHAFGIWPEPMTGATASNYSGLAKHTRARTRLRRRTHLTYKRPKRHSQFRRTPLLVGTHEMSFRLGYRSRPLNGASA